MEHLTKVLLEKREQLLQIKQFIASDRSVEQKGILRTSYSCGSCQYYLRTEENESRYPRGQYLHKNDMDIARKIAQRDYNQKMLKEIEKQLKIADKLYKKGVPYRYEFPHRLAGMGMVYSDFTCLRKWDRKEIIWEHFGMMTDSAYAKNAMKKIELYGRNGYYAGKNIIYTIPVPNSNTKPVAVPTEIIMLFFFFHDAKAVTIISDRYVTFHHK